MKNQKVLSVILALILVVSTIPLTALADETMPAIPYVDETGSSKVCTSYWELISSYVNWTSGWYVVNSNVTIEDRIFAFGDVCLILCDGCTLTAKKGIDVPESYSLTIYAQANNTGKIVATGGYDQAGIGSVPYGDYDPTGNGPITINGGIINATGGFRAAGIGSGFGRRSGPIVINGGKVTAKGGTQAAGIGAGCGGRGASITINGGVVNATGGDYSGAGIGHGDKPDYKSSGVNRVTINGGTVTASAPGSWGAAAIGGGRQDPGSIITINGGTVNANGGKNSAAIGGGPDSNPPASGGGPGSTATQVYINGGKVNAYAGTNGIGIGNVATNSSAIVKLSWTNSEFDRIFASSYSGCSITFLKDFVLEQTNTLATTDTINNQAIIPYALSREIDFSVQFGKTLMETHFSENYFSGSAYDYNHDLAWLSLCLELASFSLDENVGYGLYGEHDEEHGWSIVADPYTARDGSNITDLRIGNYTEAYAENRGLAPAYKNMGFQKVEYYKYDTSLNNTDDTVGFSIAERPLASGRTLLAIVLRGGGYGCEWSSNFNVGTGEYWHDGFKNAAANVYRRVMEYLGREENANKQYTLWITGYSRASATANLLTAVLDKESETIPQIERDKIFAYLFATPQGITENVADVHDEKYNNIFSIVNPCDIVPNVAFSKWGFTRYGVTLQLNVLNPLLESTLDQVRNANEIVAVQSLLELLLKGFPTCADSHNLQTIIFETLEYTMTKRHYSGGASAEWTGISSNDYYSILFHRYPLPFSKAYSNAHQYLKVKNLNVGHLVIRYLNYSKDDLLGVLLTICELHDVPSDVAFSKLSTLLSSNISSLLTQILPGVFGIDFCGPFAIQTNVGDEHVPTTKYVPYMYMQSSANLFSKISVIARRVAIHCPVDVKVYDDSGNLLAEITDHTIVNAEIPVVLDADLTEFYFLESVDHYHIEITPTDEGEMSYIVTDYDEEQNVIYRTGYYDIQINPGQKYTADLEAMTEYIEGMYDLTCIENESTETTIGATEVITENFDVSLQITVEGCGHATGDGNYIKGDTVVLRAYPENGHSFVGWYENDALLSEEATYDYQLQTDASVQAIFVENQDEHVWNSHEILEIPGEDETYTLIWTCGNCGMTMTEEINKPVIVSQPQDASAPLGETVLTEFTAEGEDLTYQWYLRDPGKEDFTKSGLKGNSYYVELVRSKIGREVYCVVTDKYGYSIQTRTATLNVELPEGYNGPVIQQEPEDSFVDYHKTASTTVTAEGEELIYQWYFRDVGEDSWTRSGLKGDTYSVEMVPSKSGREVYCVITDAYRISIASQIATLNLQIPAEYVFDIEQQPESSVAEPGEEVSVSVGAVGLGLKYQWFFRDAGKETWSQSSIKADSYFVTMTNARNGRELYCVVTDQYGQKLESEIATIGFHYPDNYDGPAILTQPQDSNVDVGEQASASFEAEGYDLTYQWYFKDPGKETWSRSSLKSNTYYVTMTAAKSGRQVKCVVTDKYGLKAETDPATLSFQIPEDYVFEIVDQPQDVIVDRGEIAQTSVSAVGAGLTYKWYGLDTTQDEYWRSSIRTDTYSVTMVPSKSGRKVYCVVTDKYGNTITSETATLLMNQ